MLLFIIINKNYYHDWAPMRVSSILGNSTHLFYHSVITMKVLAPTPPLPLPRSQGTLVKSQEVKSCLLFRSSSGFSAHSEGFHCFPWLEASSSGLCVVRMLRQSTVRFFESVLPVQLCGSFKSSWTSGSWHILLPSPRRAFPTL